MSRSSLLVRGSSFFAAVVCCLTMSVVHAQSPAWIEYAKDGLRAQELGKPVSAESDLNVAAIAGNPVVSQAVPVLNVSAIARATSLCTCDGCSLKTPHVCGAPGCTCAAGCVCEPDLNLAAMSPKRQTPQLTAVQELKDELTKLKTKLGKAEPQSTAIAPKYQWQQVCNGRFCSWQMVRIQ